MLVLDIERFAMLIVPNLSLDFLGLFLGATGRLLERNLFAAIVIDLKHAVNLLETESLGLDVKVPDEWHETGVEDCEHDKESPADVGKA